MSTSDVFTPLLVSPKTPIPSPRLDENDSIYLRKKYLVNFEKACDIFFDHKDVECGILIGMVEFSRQAGPGAALLVNWELLESHDSKTREAVLSWLTAVGIPEGKWLYPEDLSVYIQVKREKRAQWHQRAAARLQFELENLISTNIQEVSKKAGTTPRTLSMLLQLSHFIHCYKTTVGIGPFIRGLMKFLTTQSHDFERAFVWSLDDATLTQSGEEFLAASVALMIKTIGFRPISLPKLKENPLQLREWLIHPSLTDFQLASLLRLLTIEAPKLSPGGCSGTSQPSQPVVSRLQKHRLSFLPNCCSWLINSSYSILIRPLACILVALIRISVLIIPRFMLA